MIYCMFIAASFTAVRNKLLFTKYEWKLQRILSIHKKPLN